MGCFTTKYKVNRDLIILCINGKDVEFKKGDIIYRDFVQSIMNNNLIEISININGKLKSLGTTDQGCYISNTCINLSDLED